MEKIIYKTNDGISLNGILEKNNSDTCIVMMHGIRADKEEHGNFTKLVNLLNTNNIDSFRFDIRGHGENETDSKTISISNAIIDLESTIQLIIQKGYKSIILLGASFGAGIISLLDYKKFSNVKGLILWYPAIVYEKIDLFSEENIEKSITEGYIESKSMMTGKSFIFTKEFMMETREYKPYDKLIDNSLNKLFIQGTKDTSIPYEYTMKCAEKSPNSKLILIQEGTHGFFDNNEHLKSAIDETIRHIEILNKLDCERD